MTAKLWSLGTNNAFSTTLNGSVLAGATSITLTSVTGLQAPGLLVIDRVDSTGAASPTVREYISFTGISTNTLTGVTKGLGGSSDQAHSSGANVEEIISVTHWNDLLTFLRVSLNSDGSLAPLSNVTISNAIITTSLNVSGASLVGNFPITPVWKISGQVSAATSSVGSPLDMPQGGNISWVSFIARSPASGGSIVFDIKKNGSSIFGVLPVIAGAGTYVSTASINTKSFVAGDVFSIDINAVGAGSIGDIFAKFRAY